jgi:hypothetical protein
MSSNLAYARPARTPNREPEAHPRHIEVIATRAQRKARPKIAYAVATIASLFVIFAAQLLLSIVVSDGAYQIEALEGQQKELLRTQQALTENLNLLDSPQHLTANAAHLGMVPSAAPLYLDLETGGIAGAPGTVDHGACGGTCNLVANSLLTGMPLVDKTPPAGTVGATGTTGTATTTTQPTTQPTTPQTPAVVDALPAPITH